MKAIIHYYGGRFIFVVCIIRVASGGNEPLLAADNKTITDYFHSMSLIFYIFLG